MIKDKKLAAALITAFQQQGVQNHMTVITAYHPENGNWKGAWFVTCSDRQNVANTMQDLRVWTDTEEARFDFAALNEKRKLFNLPELEQEGLQEHDRDAQRPYTDAELAHMIKESEWPVEEDALNRVD